MLPATQSRIAPLEGPKRGAWLRPGTLRLARARLQSGMAAFGLERDAELPPANPTVERTARGVVLLSTLWFLAAATWELTGPFAAGHYAAATAVATGGENMWRFGVIGPVPAHPPGEPLGQDFYCHHPWGIFWVAALFVKVFGHEFFVCRLPAVLMSACMPGLLYAFGRAAWGPVAGAVAALAFTVLPISLAFANFFALEVPVMFGVALCAWAYLRLSQTGRRRWFWLSLAGLLFAENADWAGFVFGGLLLMGAFLRRFVLSRFLPACAAERLVTFWGAAACLSVAAGAFYLVAFHALGNLEEFLRSGEHRSYGANLPLPLVLESRRVWLETAFTPLAIALGKLALPVILLRALFLRREAEWLPLAVLNMALFQYLVFKQGADVHFFWPHYFALYFALAMGALAQTFQGALSRSLPRLTRPAPWLSLGFFSLLLALIIPDGVRALVFARKTGGRFNEKGLIIHPDVDKAAALSFLSDRMQEGASVLLHPSMKQSYWMDWLLERPIRTGKAPRGKASGVDRYFLLDPRFTSLEELRSVAHHFGVVAVGPYWFVDRARKASGFEAYRITLREPSLFEAYFVQGSHALRSIEPDPWAAWELADHFGESPLDPPSVEPNTLEELRIAHNAALARDDHPRARALEARLKEGSRDVRCAFENGIELVAVHFEPGSTDLLTVTLRANNPPPDSSSFRIHSVVEEAPALSLTPLDPTVREVGMPSVIPHALWKPGYLYSSVTEVMKRPGRERFVAHFARTGARTVQGGCTVLVVE